MYSNICNFFSFVFFIVILISRLIFAPWTTRNPPIKPADDVQLTCTNWILYHGFLEENDKKNEDKAIKRELTLDPDVFLWAVGYAYVLSCLSSRVSYGTISPSEFCANRGVNDTEVSFLALKDATRTCKDWIYLYGYEVDDPYLNWEKAQLRNFLADDYISHWAMSYALVLDDLDKNNAISPSKFCDEVRNNGNQLLSFMARNAMRLTCTDWIELYGFTDNVLTNHMESYIQYSEIYMDQIHHWALSYNLFLYDVDEPDAVSPSVFCDEVRKNRNQLMPFMSRNAMKLTCIGWIELYGFTDDVRTNYRESYLEYNEIFMDQIHYWAKEYFTDLSVIGYRPRNPLTPRLYCERRSMNEDITFSFFAYLNE